MDAEVFDLIVFGGGKAGKTLAMDQARAGKRVAMVERGLIGGSCINVACIPSKALIRSAQVHGLARRAAAYGTPVESGLDMPTVAGRTADVVAEMIAFNRKGFEASGLELVLGWGRFVAPRVIEVLSGGGPRRFTAPAIYLNLGTVAAIPPVPGLVDAKPLTHVEALLLEELPRHLLILGGGYIGLELGQAYRLLGAEVTIVEQAPRIAAREDDDVAAALQKALEEDGVNFLTGVAVTQVSGRSGSTVTVTLADGRSMEGSHILVAAGRKPMTGDIGLDIAGVALDERGFVRTDPALRTTAEGIWALGEIAGTPMFTHASLDDYRIIKSGLSGGGYVASARIVPYCVFVEPELARIGLNEKEARARGLSCRVFRMPMDVVPRARTSGERKGMMKALVDDADRIAGFTMLGAHAGEVMTAVQMAMLGGLTYQAVRDAIIAHPTLGEGLGLLFGMVPTKV